MRTRRHYVAIDPDAAWQPAMVRALERGHVLSAVYSPRFGRSYPGPLALAHSAVRIDTSSQQALNRALAEITRRRAIDSVLVHRDAIIEKVAVACEANGIPFTSWRSLRVARSKLLTRRALEAQGMAGVKFRAVRRVDHILRAARAIGFPCVLKPATGHGSMLAFRLDNVEQVKAAARKINRWRATSERADRWVVANGFVCEEWIDGPIVSVELSIVAGHPRLIALALGTFQSANPCAGFGSVIPFDVTPSISKACVDYAKKVCRILGLDLGVCDLEMVWTDAGPVLLEANPRMMGGAMPLAYELATGVSFADILLDTYAGRPLSSKGPVKTKVTVIRKLMPSQNGRVAHTVDAKWLNAIRTEDATIMFCNDALTPGARVRRLQVLGRILVVSDDAVRGFVIADQIVRRLEMETGLEFIFGSLPAIASSVSN